MYSFYLHVPSGKTTKQVGYFNAEHPLEEGKIIEGSILWSSYKHTDKFHKIEEIKEYTDETTFLVIITIYTGKVKKRSHTVINLPVIIYAARTRKPSREKLPNARHRNGYTPKKHNCCPMRI